MVAPNGARLTKSDHPGVPMTIPEIISDIRACVVAGADGAHAHVRDQNGEHVLDVGLYRELLSEAAGELPGFYMQITTEAAGRYTPGQQRALVHEIRPKAVSIALREITSGVDERQTRTFFHDCHEAGTAVQHILYDMHDIENFGHMIQSGTIPAQDPMALLVLGKYNSPSDDSNREELQARVQRLLERVPGVDWAVCAFGARETVCLVAALKMGGKARIGFENNRLNSDNSLATCNAERVRDLSGNLSD